MTQKNVVFFTTIFLFVQHLVARVLALEFRHHLLHLLHHLHGIIAVAYLVKLLFIPFRFLVVIFPYGSNLDFRVMGRFRYLHVVQQFLVQFFPVPKSAIGYFHLLGSTHSDHALCQVGYSHRLSHVEDVDFSSLSHGTRFQH